MNTFRSSVKMSNNSEGFLYGHFRSQEELKTGILLSQIVSPVLLLVGTIANVLAVKIFTRRSMQKSFMSKYLMNLSIADLIVLYVCLLREWIRYQFDYDVRMTTNWLCKLHWWLYYVTLDYSVWLLTSITIVRMMTVFKPTSGMTRYLKEHGAIVIFSICLTSIIVNFHFLFGIELQTLEQMSGDRHQVCGPGSKEYDTFFNYVWHYVDLCTFSLIPFLILSLGNVCIIYRVVSNKKKMKRQLQTSGQGKVSSMTKLLVALNFVFIVCSLPICVYLTGMKYWVPPDIPSSIQEEDPWYVFVSLLMYINNTVNFFLYTLSGSRFRNELKKLIQCKGEETHSDVVANTSQSSVYSAKSLACLFTVFRVKPQRIRPETSESYGDYKL